MGYDYSGPLVYEAIARLPGAGRDYSGPISFFLGVDNQTKPPRIYDHSGPVRFRTTSPGHFMYIWDEDFVLFGGAKRYANDQMSLAYSNMVSQLSITNVLFHYRFGTNHNFENVPFSALKTATEYRVGMAAVQLGELGASSSIATNNDFAFVRGGDLGDLVLLDSNTAKNSFVMGGWIKYEPRGTNTQRLWGMDHTKWQAASDILERVMCAVGFDTDAEGAQGAGMRVNAFRMDTNGNSTGDWQWTLLDEHFAFVEHAMYFVMVQLTWRNDAGTHKGISRIFIDGKLIFEGERAFNVSFNYNGNVALHASDGYRPGILAQSLALTDDGSAYSHWGVLEGQWPFAGTVDEVFWARWSPTIGGSVQPKYIGSGGGSGLNPLWDAGEEVVFSPTRHPNPSTEGEVAFVSYGPVEDTNMGSEAAIYRVYVDFILAGLANGQEVHASIRANNTVFAANDGTIPWSNWYLLQDATENNVFGGGTGRYVQLRLKIIPDNSPRRLEAPLIETIEFWVSGTGNGIEMSSDLGGILTIGDGTAQATLGGVIKVQQPSLANLLGTIKVQFAAPPADLNGVIHINSATFSDLLGEIDILTLLTDDLLGEITIDEAPHNASADLLGEIHISQLLESSLLGRIQVQAFDLLGIIKVGNLLELPILRGRLRIIPDEPSAVVNLRANAPAETWQSVAAILFEWNAAISRSAITGYFWFVDSSPVTAVDPFSWNSTNLLSHSVNFDNIIYGTGKWYFHVAALNAAGNVGPTSHYGVWYNHPPTSPGGIFLTVNGIDTIATVPLLSSNPVNVPRFAWSPSTDSDQSDSITYQIDFATQSDFAEIGQTGLSSIKRTVEFHQMDTLDLIPSLSPGRYYWRVRAFDGHQYSNWSPVGSFRFNFPPEAPTGLVILDR